ncbi:MAG: DEAD/DEAH box helicase [Myxococcota bacterium]
MTTFASLGLAEPLLRALARCGYETPTPVQALAIPPLLEGRDLLGCAQTGTGKTAAFALPVLHRLFTETPRRNGAIRALVLTPTRELAAQVEQNFQSYGTGTRLAHTVVTGGVNPRRQIEVLRNGVDVLVACPGRLLDLHGQGHVDLSHIEQFVLDEADRMLDMGFVHDVRKVMARLPSQRQNVLVSATLPKPIVKLAHELLTDPVEVSVSPEAPTTDAIDQRVMFVEKSDKRRLLSDIIKTGDIDQAIVFTRTKHGANRLVKQLDQAGIEARAIHGNKSQNARTRALEAFRSGELSILVATDVVSRGIDVEGVSHVVNFDLPNDPESYVHRIGRTGRAGRTGTTIAFCDPSEVEYLQNIERLLGAPVPVDRDHAWHSDNVVVPAAKPSRPKNPGRSRRPSRRRSRGRRRSGASKPSAP